MTALQIKSTKNMMNLLLASEQFDAYEVEEASIVTFNTFQIDGHVVRDFYDTDELAEGALPIFSSWKEVRPICFQLIKGKKPPVSMRIVLHAPAAVVAVIAAEPDCGVDANLIRSLALNIRYEGGVVTCVTGTAFTTFVMDKSVDALWDQYVGRFLDKLGLDYEEKA